MRVVLRQSTTFCVTCQLSTSAEIALHWVENSRKINWRPVENSSCKTCWILTHLNWRMIFLQESTLTTWFGSMSGEVTEWGHDFACVSSRPRGSGTTCLQERQTLFIKYLLAKAASCKEFGIVVVDISVAFMHARTDEEIYVKVPSGIKSSKSWKLKAAVNGTRKASKDWQEYSSDRLVTNILFQQNDINPCIYKRFCDDFDLEQHGEDFLVCVVWHEVWKNWQRNSTDIFWWRSLKLWVWNLNTRVKLIFSNVASLLRNLVGVLSWIKGMWKVCWMEWWWIIANPCLLLDRRDSRATMRRRNWMPRNIESSDPVLESVSTWQSNASTLPSARRKLWERQLDRPQPPRQSWSESRVTSKDASDVCWISRGWESWTTSSMWRWMRKPKDKVLNVCRSTGNWPVLHITSLVSDTGNRVTILSWVIGQDDHEGLYWGSVRETFAGVPDSTNFQNRTLDGQQQRQGHHTTSWARA